MVICAYTGLVFVFPIQQLMLSVYSQDKITCTGSPRTTHNGTFAIPDASSLPNARKGSIFHNVCRGKDPPHQLSFSLLEMSLRCQQGFLCAEPHTTPATRVQLLLLTRVYLSRI